MPVSDGEDGPYQHRRRHETLVSDGEDGAYSHSELGVEYEERDNRRVVVSNNHHSSHQMDTGDFSDAGNHEREDISDGDQGAVSRLTHTSSLAPTGKKRECTPVSCLDSEHIVLGSSNADEPEDDNDEDDNDDENSKPTRKRPRNKDLSQDVRVLVMVAQLYFRYLLASVDAYPTAKDENEFATESWAFAIEFEEDPPEYSVKIEKLVRPSRVLLQGMLSITCFRSRRKPTRCAAKSRQRLAALSLMHTGSSNL